MFYMFSVKVRQLMINSQNSIHFSELKFKITNMTLGFEGEQKFKLPENTVDESKTFC